MIAVIQSAAGRQPHAGHMKTRDGRRVLFVADPKQAPSEPGLCHARPDSRSSFCVTWRKLVVGYNENRRNNPLGLLPAWSLYPDEIYAQLVEQLGVHKVYILSAGWGLVKSSFLIPNLGQTNVRFRWGSMDYTTTVLPKVGKSGTTASFSGRKDQVSLLRHAFRFFWL